MEPRLAAEQECGIAAKGTRGCSQMGGCSRNSAGFVALWNGLFFARGM